MKQNASVHRCILLASLLSTQSLFTPVKTLFLLRFLMQAEDISFFKFLFTFASFALELPSGYFSDRFGNRTAVLLSRLFTLCSLACYCLVPSFAGFAAANLLLGLADAWESGAQDSYFLALGRQFDLRYDELKVTIEKYGNLFSFALMLCSSFLYTASPYLPFVGTMVLVAGSALALFHLPDEEPLAGEETSAPLTFTAGTKLVLGKIVRNRPLLWQMFFTITCTAIYIINFEYYTLVFQQAGIPDGFVGPIYSTFRLLAGLGIIIYQKPALRHVKNLLLVLSPLSFLLLVSGKIPLIFMGVVVQQLCYSYYNMSFQIYLLHSIDDPATSSAFQSAVSFLNIVYRMALTLGITALFGYFSCQETYRFFVLMVAAVTLAEFACRRNDRPAQ